MLMYRPLYMFGNNGNSVAVNYPLSLANAPDVLRRRQDRDDHDEGLEVEQRRDRRRQRRGLLAQHDEGRDGQLLRLRARPAAGQPGLLPATGPDTVVLHLKSAGLQHLVHLQPARRDHPDAAWPGTSPPPAPRPGSGGCTTDTAADKWAKCTAVYNFLPRRPRTRTTYATSPIWGGRRRAVEAVQLQHRRPRSRSCRTPTYSGSPEAEARRRSSTARTPTTRPSTRR